MTIQDRIYKFDETAGVFLAGVPARDLTEAEAKQYGVTNNPLWQKEAKKPITKKDGE